MNDHLRERIASLKTAEEETWAQTDEAQRLLTRLADPTDTGDPGATPVLGRRRSGWTVLLGAVAAAAIAAVVAGTALLGTDTDAPPVAATPVELTSSPREIEASRPPGYWFRSLAQLVATSEVVVYGTVESVRRGHALTPDDPTLLVRDVTVTVQRQFSGPPVGDRIVVDQESIEVDGPGNASTERAFEFAEQPWVYPGDQVIYFLVDTDTRPEGHYTIVAMPGQMVVHDGTVLTPAEDPVAGSVNGEDWDTVRTQLLDAVRQADHTPPIPGAPN